MNIYFDIETIPAQDPVAIELIKADIEKQKLSVKAPSNYKDQEKIDAYIKAEIEKLDAEFDFMAMFHGVDERVPVDGLTFGVRTLKDFLENS